LHWAAYLNCEQVVAYILSETVATINLKDNDGNTPLMVAVIYGNTRIVRRLLMKGANRYIKNKEDKMALDIAR
jgi:palmitoyltransferase